MRLKGNNKEHTLMMGDFVLVKQRKINKWTPPFEPILYTVTETKGSQVTARRITDGREITRDAAHYKLVNALMDRAEDIVIDKQEKDYTTRFQGKSDTEQQVIHTEEVYQPVGGLSQPTDDMQDIPEEHPVERTRRSNRPKQLPKKFEDFVMT